MKNILSLVSMVVTLAGIVLFIVAVLATAKANHRESKQISVSLNRLILIYISTMLITFGILIFTTLKISL